MTKSTVPNFGDKEILSDALSSQKFITENYNMSTNESSSPKVRNTFMKILKEEHMIQADVYNQMSMNGWYPTKMATPEEISQAKVKYQKQQPTKPVTPMTVKPKK